MPQRKKSSEDIVNAMISSAIGGGIMGVAGGWTLAFFRPDLASMGPSFLASAAMGAIAYPLAVLLRLLINRLTRDSEFFNQHPVVKEVFKDTASLLIGTAAYIGAAFLLGAPITATVASFMIIPTIFYALRMLSHAINALDDSPKLDVRMVPTAP